MTKSSKNKLKWKPDQQKSFEEQGFIGTRLKSLLVFSGHAICQQCLNKNEYIFNYDFYLLTSGLPPAAPCSPFGFEEAFMKGGFKEERGVQGGKRHFRREEVF